MTTGKDNPASRGTTYERYKTHTRGFRDALAKLVPSKTRLVSVSDLAKAADFVLDLSKKGPNNKKKGKKGKGHCIGLDQISGLLQNLKECIRLREVVAATYVSDTNRSHNDDGHGYIIQVLKYCLQILQRARQNLRRLRSASRNKSSSVPELDRSSDSESTADTVISDGFDVLQMDSDSEDEDDSDSDAAIERPSAPSKNYSIEEDLIKGSWAFQANLFFLSAESMFEIVAQAYESLNENMDLMKNSIESTQEYNHQTVVLLMQTTATVNLAMEHMKSLEKSFFLEHGSPFHSIYHVFAVLIFSEQIKKMEAILGPVFVKQNPELCVTLAAWSIRFGFFGSEAYFGGALDPILTQVRNKTYYHKKARRKVSQQQLDQFKTVCLTICASADFERMADPKLQQKGADEGSIQMTFENYYAQTGQTLYESVEIVPPQWLKNYGRLGGPSGILYTFGQMENLRLKGPNAEDVAKAVVSEDGLCLKKTRCIMKTAFVRRIFPRLWNMLATTDNKAFNKLPGIYSSQGHFMLCMPFLRQFDHWMEKGGVGPDFSMGFALHSLVYGMYLLESGGNGERLAAVAKLASEKFGNQLEEVADSPYLDVAETLWQKNGMAGLKLTQSFMSLPKTSIGAQRPLWNPLFAGSHLLLVAFHSNMEVAFEKSDLLMQHRITLHLYNALRQRAMIPQIPVLELLGRALDSSTIVWPNEKPTQESFLKSFLLATGDFKRVAEPLEAFLSIKDSNEKLLSSLLTPHKKDVLGRNQDLDEAQQNAMLRVCHMHQICADYTSKKASDLEIYVQRASDISRSHGYIKFQDFPHGGQESSLACSPQASLVCESISEDHAVLSINWLKTGCLLEEFVTKLLDALEITPLVEVFYVQSYDNDKMPSPLHEQYFKRKTSKKFLADKVFRELEYQGSNPELCTYSQQAAQLMLDFFTNTATEESLTFF